MGSERQKDPKFKVSLISKPGGDTGNSVEERKGGRDRSRKEGRKRGEERKGGNGREGKVIISTAPASLVRTPLGSASLGPQKEISAFNEEDK